MINQHGGLRKKNNRLDDKSALLNMINSSGATLQLLQNNDNINISKTGIIGILNVEESNSEYLDLYERGVTSFVIKFVILNSKHVSISGVKLSFKYKGFDIVKRTESSERFKKEAQIQQDIWFKSVFGANPKIEICPSVASLLLLDNPASQIFLKERNEKIKELSPDLYNILFGFINKQSNRNTFDNGLGVLVMPNIKSSVHLEYIMRLRKSTIEQDENEFIHCMAMLVAQVVRLFISFDVIHFDINTGNVLFFEGVEPFTIRCVLIDFGLSSNISEQIQDNYLSVDEKRVILGKIEQFNRMFEETSDIEGGGHLMFSIMNYLTLWDCNKYYQIYSPLKSDVLRLNGFEQFEELKEIELDETGEILPVKELERGLGKRKRKRETNIEYNEYDYPIMRYRYQMRIWLEAIKKHRKAMQIFQQAFIYLKKIMSLDIPKADKGDKIEELKRSNDYYPGTPTPGTPAFNIQDCDETKCTSYISYFFKTFRSLVGRGKRKTKKYRKSKKSKKISNKYKNKKKTSINGKRGI